MPDNNNNSFSSFISQFDGIAINIVSLFDEAWYVSSNPDVVEAGVPGLAHYLESGWREGRSPHPLFDEAWYRNEYGVLNSSGLLHYLRSGRAKSFSTCFELLRASESTVLARCERMVSA